jgi:hypothetical protein
LWVTTKVCAHQGFPIAVSPSAHLRGSLQTDRACHPIAVLSATVAAGSSLSWSPLVAASASAAVQMQRSQAAASACHVNDPSDELVNRSPAEGYRVEPPESAGHADPLVCGGVTLFETGVAVEGGRAARPRPCDWEPFTPLVTVPTALVLVGSACAAMATPAKNDAPKATDLQRVRIGHLLAFPPPL